MFSIILINIKKHVRCWMILTLPLDPMAHYNIFFKVVSRNINRNNYISLNLITGSKHGILER